MIMSRRRLLGAALTGASLAAVGLPVGRATAGTGSLAEAPRLLVDPAAPQGFVDGARVALKTLGLGGIAVVERPSDSTLADHVAWLTARPGRRAIGLIGDSEAFLMQQMAPAGRVRWLSLAQHRASPDGTFGSRHRVTSLPGNRGLSRRLADELTRAEVDYVVFDQPVGGSWPSEDTPPQRGVAAAGGLGWDVALGEALALIAADRWPSQPPQAAQVFAGQGRRPGGPTTALTSFVMAS
jgi:hypothetical protein